MSAAGFGAVNNQTIAGQRRTLCPTEEPAANDAPERIKVSDLREGVVTPIRTKSGGVAILVLHEGRPLAFHAVCPHMGADLRKASCVAGEIRCFWHGYSYSIKTGQFAGNPNVELMKNIRIASEHFDPSLQPSYRLREHAVVIDDGWVTIGDGR